MMNADGGGQPSEAQNDALDGFIDSMTEELVLQKSRIYAWELQRSPAAALQMMHDDVGGEAGLASARRTLELTTTQAAWASEYVQHSLDVVTSLRAARSASAARLPQTASRVGGHWYIALGTRAPL
jgi:hypothetical protein